VVLRRATAAAQAIHFDADEIIVATASASRSGWLAREAVRRAQARYPRRVRHVVVGHDPGEAAAA
jgi:hypothetical protein